MNQTTIQWSEAEQIAKDSRIREKKFREAMLEEFLASKCDLFSSGDWQYYENETGKSISWLMQNASYSDPEGAYGTMLSNAIDFGDGDLAEYFI